MKKSNTPRRRFWDQQHHCDLDQAEVTNRMAASLFFNSFAFFPFPFFSSARHCLRTSFILFSFLAAYSLTQKHIHDFRKQPVVFLLPVITIKTAYPAGSKNQSQNILFFQYCTVSCQSIPHSFLCQVPDLGDREAQGSIPSHCSSRPPRMCL